MAKKTTKSTRRSASHTAPTVATNQHRSKTEVKHHDVAKKATPSSRDAAPAKARSPHSNDAPSTRPNWRTNLHWRTWWARGGRVVASSRQWLRNLQQRRPHRSFRRTRRRDYARSLQLPGYIAFTAQVLRMVRAHWRTLCLLAVFYAVLLLALGAITNQAMYDRLQSMLAESGKDILTGAWGKLGEAGLLMVTAFGTGSGNLSADQQLYVVLGFLLVWLTTVWLLREYKAGRAPRLRDGLYNACAPLVATLMVVLVFLVQLIPLGAMALVYIGLSSNGVISEGFGSMLFYVLLATVAVLTLYWGTSTFIALVVVTLPGMYPMRALAAAGDLVVGRRLRVLYRLLWLFGSVAVLWCVVMIPAILLDAWLKHLWQWYASVPAMPVLAGFISSVTVVWCAAYIYLLYRKIVDDTAAPA